MSNVYSRFMSRTRGAAIANLWDKGEDFSVRRAPTGVNYGRVIGGLDATISFIDPSADDEASMSTTAQKIPPMPEIGRPESYYSQLAHQTSQQGMTHQHEAAKVGQYITLALEPSLAWDDKLKFFKHALKRHCAPPPFPDDDVWLFYQNLRHLVREYCGTEALRLASIEDDLYAARVNMGQTRQKIEDDAEKFFMNLMGGSGDRCPDYFNEAEWSQLKLLRDQWI